eukprot:scaffold50_cov162-Ochromonas_danica.AAC.20
MKAMTHKEIALTVAEQILEWARERKLKTLKASDCKRHFKTTLSSVIDLALEHLTEKKSLSRLPGRVPTYEVLQAGLRDRSLLSSPLKREDENQIQSKKRRLTIDTLCSSKQQKVDARSSRAVPKQPADESSSHSSRSSADLSFRRKVRKKAHDVSLENLPPALNRK